MFVRRLLLLLLFPFVFIAVIVDASASLKQINSVSLLSNVHCLFSIFFLLACILTLYAIQASMCHGYLWDFHIIFFFNT